MINAYDIVTARIMLYCLHKIEGFSYQQISKAMGYSDGVCHKFLFGGVGSALFIKCVGDYFDKAASQKSKLVKSRLPGHYELFGRILYARVRSPEFLRVIRLITEDIDVNCP